MAAGDADALRSLYELHIGRVYAIAVRILGSEEDARDVAQDVFLKAWRQAARYQPERGEVVSWLVLMARSAAIDRHRQRHRRNRILLSLADETDGFDQFSPDAGDGRALLEGPLARLTPVQRRALELAFFGGYSHTEIADRMRTSLHNVKNHLRRGLLKLRRVVADHE